MSSHRNPNKEERSSLIWSCMHIMNKRSVDFVSQAQNGKHLRRGDLWGSVNIINTVRSHSRLSACSWLHYHGWGGSGTKKENIVFRITHITSGRRRDVDVARRQLTKATRLWLVRPVKVMYCLSYKTTWHPSCCGTSEKRFSKSDDRDICV